MKQIEKTEGHFVYTLTEPSGTGCMNGYEVFPGIHLVYSHFQMRSCEMQFVPPKGVTGIAHCCEGKLGWELENGDLAYLGGGCLMPCRYGSSSRFDFPAGIYRGVTLMLDLSCAGEGLPEGFPVHPQELPKRFQAAGALDISKDLRSSCVLGVVYEAETLGDWHRKIACLNYLLLLDGLEWPKIPLEPLYFSRVQVMRIREMEAFLVSHLEHRYTLRELSEKFSLPVTAIRKCFSGVYGCSVAEYMRHQRMDTAMRLLSDRQTSISAIAAALGYENASKFSAAFRSYSTISPQMYREQFR